MQDEGFNGNLTARAWTRLVYASKHKGTLKKTACGLQQECKQCLIPWDIGGDGREKGGSSRLEFTPN
jgi:hypothetical protein